MLFALRGIASVIFAPITSRIDELIAVLRVRREEQ